MLMRIEVLLDGHCLHRPFLTKYRRRDEPVSQCPCPMFAILQHSRHEGPVYPTGHVVPLRLGGAEVLGDGARDGVELIGVDSMEGWLPGEDVGARDLSTRLGAALGR